MSGLFQDLRYALRQLLKHPGFTAVVVITLALGIGANTAIFAIVRGVLLRPLPFQNPSQLVQFEMINADSGLKSAGASFLNFEDWRTQNTVFQGMAAIQPTTFNLTGSEEPEQIHGWRVSDDFFSLMGMQPILGRSFQGKDALNANERIVVVSHRLWQRRLAADPGIQGKPLIIDGSVHMVMGVMPASFNLPGDLTDAWIPLSRDLNQTPRINQFLIPLARLKEGVPLSQAQSEMDVISRRLAKAYPDANSGWGVSLRPLHQAITKRVRPALLILFSCVGLVLLLVCLNVGNLVLAKGAARRHEIALRIALGASRFQIVRQFMAENLLLSLSGGALGLWIAFGGLRLFQTILPSNANSTSFEGMHSIPMDTVRMDGSVLIFTLLACVVVSLLFGLIPALQVTSRLDPLRDLKQGARGVEGAGRDRFRDGLIVAQVSLAFMLLISAALLTGSLSRLLRVNPGFNAEKVMCAEIALPDARYAEQPKIAAFFDQLLERASALPGVDRVGAVNCPPFAVNFMASFRIEGRAPTHPGQLDTAMYRVATPGYLEAINIPLLQGRAITREDGANTLPVLVIDETMARRYWPGESPIGAKVNVGRMCTVVGVVGSVKHNGLDDIGYPTVYFPQSQQRNVRQMTLIVKTSGSALASAEAIRAAVRAIDPNQPVARIRSLESDVTESLGNRRLTAWGTGSFAALALVLAAIGLYGVVSYSVARRSREIGIRMALGAQPGDALKLLMNYGIQLTAIGIALGVGGAFATTRLLTTVLYATSPVDPAVFAGVVILLAVVAMIATYLPARRVIRIDPMTALRNQ